MTPFVQRWRGRRSEVQVLVPIALLVLLVLTAFTLVSYRSAVELLVQERRSEAARLARTMARELAAGPLHNQRLQQIASRTSPQAGGVVVLDERGARVAEAGAPVEVTLPLETLQRATGFGPAEASGDAVVGVAPFAWRQARRYVRLDLPSPTLARHARSLPLLTFVVISVSAMLFVTLLLYLRYLMAPYETLLERARSVAGPRSESSDDVDFLLQTFDRALDALSRQPSDADDMAALERTLAPSLESGLLLLDHEGCVLALNGIGGGLLGVEGSIAGRPLAEALAHQPEVVDLLDEAIREGRGARRRQCPVRAGGKSLTLGLSVHPLRRDDGGKRGWLVLFADLTQAEQRAQERRLAESLARIGEITAGVAHEMRNALASLRGHLTLLERRKDASSVDEGLAEIRHEADHLKRVLDDFLSFARPGSARLEEVDLQRLVRRAIADPALGNAAIRVRPPPEPLPAILGDPQLLERALRNLVHNAVQAQAESDLDAEVEIRFEADRDSARIVVEDRGPGVPEEMRDRLFVPFATGRAEGVGLGLALTHRIIDLHGGRVALEDRRRGGTRAVLSFTADSFATERNDPVPEVASDAPADRT